MSLSIAWGVHIVTSYINYNLLIGLSLISLPVIAYSIYVQAVVVKKWCPLCLATASVLCCQFLLSYFLNSLYLGFDTMSFLILGSSTFFVFTIYGYIKPLISKNLSLSKTEIEFYKFKRKFSLFESLHHRKPFLDTSISQINEIIFGNKNAKIEVVVITNPLCGYCKATHQAIDYLLKNYTNDIKVTIRFNINTENKEDISYKISTALINLYQKDIVACREAMHQIYTDGVDVSKWLETYKTYTANTQYEILETEKQWCTSNNINFTPSVYLNNKEFPKEYDLSDLSFFMEDLSLLPSSRREETEKQVVK
jgi:thiol-disulfide isomerase/thioredoxin